MTKITISAQVYVHGYDTPFETDDYKAINAWMHGQDAYVEIENELCFVPYEAVMMMVLQREVETVEPVEDPLCQPVVCETTEPCDPVIPDDPDDNGGDPPDDDNGGDDTP